jgi:hypothetical protein
MHIGRTPKNINSWRKSLPRIHQLAAFKALFDEFVDSTREQNGGSVQTLGDAFDNFVARTAIFPTSFPDYGGIYQVPPPSFDGNMRDDER